MAAEAGVIDISWNDPARHAMATITGEIGNRKIAATMYAPWAADAPPRGRESA